MRDAFTTMQLTFAHHTPFAETTVTLLESKLESIPEVSGIHGDAALPLTNEPPAPVPAEPELQPPPVDGTSVSALPAVQQDEAIPQPPVPESTAGGSVQTEVPAGMVTNDKNPLYKKYFKLLGFGAVPEQIKRQMAADGFDPSILEFSFFLFFSFFFSFFLSFLVNSLFGFSFPSFFA